MYLGVAGGRRRPRDGNFIFKAEEWRSRLLDKLMNRISFICYDHGVQDLRPSLAIHYPDFISVTSDDHTGCQT